MRSVTVSLLVIALGACRPSSTAPIDASSPVLSSSGSERSAATQPESPDAAPWRAPSFRPEMGEGGAEADRFAGVPVRQETPFRGTAVDFDITTLAESPPASLAVDGRVDEWTAAPNGALPISAGRGKLWLAFTGTAFLVAGDLDAHVDGLGLDKIRIDLTLAPPVLPPIAYSGYFASAVVDETWCRTTTYGGPMHDTHVPDATETQSCLAWLSRCRDLRSSIARRFVRTLVVDLVTGTVSGADGARVAVSKAVGSASGAAFELELPSASFPETAEMPLRTLRVAARAFSESQPKPTDASAIPYAPRDLSWRTFSLTTELRLHRAPELVARMVRQVSDEKADDFMRIVVSYVPSAKTTNVHYFYNQTELGQSAPSRPSPDIADVDVAASRKLFTLAGCSPEAGVEPCAKGGDIDIVAHAAWIDDTFGPHHPQVALVSMRGPSVVDVSPFTSFDPYTLVRRAPGVHILNVYQGPAGDYGGGFSGSAIGYAFEIMTMDGSGRFAAIEQRPGDAGARRGRAPRVSGFELSIDRDFLVGVSDLAGFEPQGGGTSARLWIDPSLKFFGLKGSFVAVGDGGADYGALQRSYEAGYRWSTTSGRYELFGRSFSP